jgi:hypothetical protein
MKQRELGFRHPHVFAAVMGQVQPRDIDRVFETQRVKPGFSPNPSFG